MSDAAFWQKKIIQLFHDPPVKVLRLYRYGGHVRFAQEWLDRFLGGKRVWLGRSTAAAKKSYPKVAEKIADLVSTGADRPVLGSGETRVDWWTQPLIRHPLDGTALHWERWDEENVNQDITACIDNRAVQNWDDPDELQKQFLWLWRALPDLLMKKHGSLWSVLPADSRVPDHSIWDHLRMASAYAGASDRPHFFIFAIGPVQTFIHQARTSRDLWIGSYLLADLTWAAMEPLVDEFGPDAILYPSLFGNPLADQWLRGAHPEAILGSRKDGKPTRSSMLPHKFVALLPEKALRQNSKDAMPGKCRQAVKKRWEDLGNAVKDYLVDNIGPGHWTTIWDRHLQSGPECSWVAEPWRPVRSRAKGFEDWFPQEIWQHYEDTRQVFLKTRRSYLRERGFDYALAHHKAQVVYQARKEIANVTQVPEPGIKCSICGEREVLHNYLPPESGNWTVKELRNEARRFWSHQELDLDREGRERLCGVCTFKRFLTKAGTELNHRWGGDPTTEEGRRAPFPSTSTIAALPFLLELTKRAERVKYEIAHFVDAFDATGFVRTFHLSGLPALEAEVKRSPQRQTLQSLFRDAQGASAGIDAEYLFPEVWQAKIREAKQDHSQPLEAMEEAKNASKTLVSAVTKASGCEVPSRHFAVLMMDGDHMGRLLLGDPGSIGTSWEDVLHPKAVAKVQDKFGHTGWSSLLDKKRLIGPALHAFISRALAHFAYEVVPWLVEHEHEHQSRLIYVGGDDLLVLAPAENVLRLAADLQKYFSAAFLREDRSRKFEPVPEDGDGPSERRLLPMLGQHASLSAAIVIAHHKQPLRPLLQHARSLLQDTAKGKLKRGSVAMSLFTRSGEKVTFGGPWKTEDGKNFVQDLATVVDAFKFKRLSGGYPYHLREMVPALLAARSKPDLRRALLRVPLEKRRGGEASVTDGELSAVERLIENGEQYIEALGQKDDQIVNPLLLARFLGRRLPESGGE